MKNLFTILLSFFLLTSDLYPQMGPPWEETNFGYNYIFRAIDFPSNQNTIGFAAGESLTYNGDGIVVKTTNGGNTWTQVWQGAGRGIEGACFVDTDHGFIAGWPKLGQGWSGFAKTTDGGTTWTPVSVTNDIYFFTDVIFKDASNGILMGQTNTGAGVWVTNNGGTTWSVGTGLNGIPQHGCHVSGNIYFLVDNNGHIQKSTNNGLSWTTVYNVGGPLYILGIDSYNDDIIMACGDNGVVIISNDGGTTWEMQTIGTDIWHDFGWESESNVFLCGTPELVVESSDGGMNWENSYPQSNYQAALYECVFTPDGHGFICGSQGTLLKRNPSCGAGFSATLTAPCTSDSVSFTDESWGNVTTYLWAFEGGTPSTSAAQNPVVVYNAPGTYDVTLTVSNPWWNNTVVKQNYITVTQMPAAPVITVNNFTLSSNVATGNQWYLDGTPIPGASGQTWEAVQSGEYWDVITDGSCVSDTSNHIYLVMTGIPGREGRMLVITPVPNDGTFTVAMPGNPLSRCDVEVYNSLGKSIRKISGAELGGTAVIAVDLGNVPAGMYVVTVTGDSRQVARILVD